MSTKPGSVRALHYVFKIGDRSKSINFFRETLGMKVLRHEEFEEGCKAQCNGPFDGRWSKTMIGYGPESHNFVLELTYNYGIGAYRLGQDWQSMSITLPGKTEDINDPDGHRFLISSGSAPAVKSVTLGVKNLQESLKFWRDELGMTSLPEQNGETASLSYGDGQCVLELRELGHSVDRGTAYGRIAFSCPTDELAPLQERMLAAGRTVLKPLVALDTPGKAQVHVVILADPDDHEICFVGDEAFAELSAVDEQADRLLDEAIAADDSAEWFRAGKPSART